MWCDVRGLRAVALSSVGCGQLGCAALLLEESGGMSGQRPRKVVPVDCAGRDGAVDVGAAVPRESLGDQTSVATMMVGAMSAMRQWLR